MLFKSRVVIPLENDRASFRFSSLQVGCKPCPIAELTAETLAERLNTLKDPEIKASAEKLAVEMNKEDGIETVIDVFYKHIPIDKMVCDVSIFMEKTALATRVSY